MTFHAPPPPVQLPPAYSRREPTGSQQRDAVLALTSQTDWGHLTLPELIDRLLRIGRTDIPLARLAEGHIDAIRILAEVGVQPVAQACYGVWASRSHGTGLRGQRAGERWSLEGTLRFASGAGVLDRALVPVWTDPEHHVLLDVPVEDWQFDQDQWKTRAMGLSRSDQIHLRGVGVEARQIGQVDYYLRRAGFFPGGVGVAAVWAGGTARVVDLLDDAVPSARRTEGQHIRRGWVDVELVTATACCRAGAHALHEASSGDDSRGVSTLVRAATATAARRLLEHVRVLARPASLAFHEDFTRAVDDLTLYVAQHNPDADAAYLGHQS